MNQPMQDLLDELLLDMEQMCRLAGVEAPWLRQRMDEGLVPARLDVWTLHRVRRLARLERDFDAVPELAALVADLEEEVRRLRQRLAIVAPARRR